MAQLGLACKATSRACAKAGIANLFGMAGDQNSSGDDQKKLDVLSNDIFVSALVNSGACSVLVSEEDEEPIIVPLEKAGRFCVAFDPLDGAPSLALTRSQTHGGAALYLHTVSTPVPPHLWQARPTSTAT
jgi:fructose-1,6-bisphosphatase I